MEHVSPPLSKRNDNDYVSTPLIFSLIDCASSGRQAEGVANPTSTKRVGNSMQDRAIIRLYYADFSPPTFTM